MSKTQIAELNTALLDNLAEGVCLLTPDGDLLYMNLAAQEMLELAEPAAEIGDISVELVAPNQWTALLQTAPAVVSSSSNSGRLTISSHLPTVSGEPIIQLTLRHDAAPPSRRPVAQQVAALARVSRELNATVLLEDVLAAVLDEALLNTGADGGIISLYDEGGHLSRLLQRGEIAFTSRHDKQAILRGRVILVADLAGSARLRSALVAPILYGGDAAGLIRLFSRKPAFFDQHGELFVAALASHAAIAIGNARRFDEIQERNVLLQQRTQQLERFVESGRVFSSERPVEEVYEDLVYAIQEGVGYHAVLLSLAERDGDEYYLRHVAGAGLPLERLRALRLERHPWSVIENAARQEYALGGAYLLPAGDATRLAPGLALPLTGELLPAPSFDIADPDASWQRRDLFFMPMRDQQGQPLGLLSLAAPLDGRRPDLNSARVLEIFANQTANAVENVQLFHDMRDYAIELQQLHNVSQQVLREPDFDQKLQFIVDGLQVSAWQRVALTLYNEEGEVSRLVTSGYSKKEHRALVRSSQPAASWRSRLEATGFQRYRRGSSYFLAAGTTTETQPFPGGDASQLIGESGAWQLGDVLIRPLYDGEGTLAGMFTLDLPSGGRRPDERSLQTIDLYAQFAISVVENFRLFSDIDRHRRELQTLFDASKALAGALDIQQIFAAIGDHLQRAAGAACYTIYSTGRGDKLVPVLTSADTLPAAMPAASSDLAQQVVETREPALRERANGQPATTAILPLLIRSELFGLVELVRDEQEEGPPLTEATLPLLGAILNQGAVALETAYLFEELDERVAQRTAALAAESERVGALMREAQVELAKQQSILESIADGVLVTGDSGKIIVANMPAVQMLGVPRSRLSNRPVGSLLGRYGEAGDRWVRTVQEWTAQPEQVQRSGVFQDRLQIDDDIISIHVSPVFAGDGYIGAVAIFRDITREVEVDRMKSEFVSTVSHELRTPMTSIKGYADLLLMGVAGELGQAQQRYLEVIKKNADRLQALVNDLLDISRIETGKTQLDLQPLDVARLIAGIVNDHVRGRMQHEGKELAVTSDVAPSLPLVLGDPEKVTRVLTNLVDNAISYTPAGGSVAIHARPAGDFVAIAVQDSGIGIAKEDHARIFERFYRAEAEEVQAVPGTGLGLAIVHSLVAMHGGQLTLESAPGEGSTFTVTLPVVPGEAG